MTSDVPFDSVITHRAELARLYQRPHEMNRRKKIAFVDDGARALIAASPLMLMATADADGRCTVSPKGGAPGFVTVLDPFRLAIPDFAGNNLLDSLHNLLANPHVGCLFLLPGGEQILRVEGRAWITTDADVLRSSADGERQPKAAIGIAVESTFVHCHASLNRARVWDPASWDELIAPSAIEVNKGHLAITDPVQC